MTDRISAAVLIGFAAMAVLAMPVYAAPAQPDLASATFIIIAGKNVSWDGSASVDAKQARSAVGGVCEFSVQHNVRNHGKAISGPFQTRFDNNAVPSGFTRQWPSIGPGQTSTQTDILRLRPGSNTLILHIDPTNQVREANEGNNQFRVTIQVNGKCDPGKGTAR